MIDAAILLTLTDSRLVLQSQPAYAHVMDGEVNDYIFRLLPARQRNLYSIISVRIKEKKKLLVFSAFWLFSLVVTFAASALKHFSS